MTDSMQPVKVTDEQLGIEQGEAPLEALELDLGHLTAFDPSAAATRDEAMLKAQATSLTQALFNALLQLPSESTPTGRTVTLPAPTTQLPRAKPLPKPKAPTKWELFAQKKGIVKHKRSKLVYDEEQQDWKRRHGYQRANDPLANPIIEAKDTDQPGKDPFAEEKANKRDRVRKNAARQADNLRAAGGGKRGGSGDVPLSLQLAASLPEHGRGKPTKRQQLHPAINSAAARANKSTASMGKFDKQPAGVKPSGKEAGKRHKRWPVVGKNTGEKSAQQSLVGKILRENS